MIYMDTWSADELRKARDVLFPDMSDSELNERIYRCVLMIYKSMLC
jgi:hypothetical protein